MKKKILLMALGLCAFSYAQKTWVTGSLPVKVEPRTLFYNGDGLEVSSADAIVFNQGNIQVDGGDFTVTNNATEDNFFMDWQSKGVDADLDGITDEGDDGYGQLIINESVAVTAGGKIALEKETVDGSLLENAQIGLPFTPEDNLTSVLAYGGNSDIVPANNFRRINHPFYRWNNALMRWDRKNVTGGINAWEYYILRPVSGLQTYNNMTERVHLGTPWNVAHVETLHDHSSLPNFNFRSSRNAYNEVYYSYIDEYFTPQGDPNWGKFQYQYGNAYTSNLDLSYIGFDEEAEGAYYDENGNGVLDPGEELNDNNLIPGLVGIYKVVNGAEVNPVYTADPNEFGVVKATADADGKFQAGDAEALLIKPLEAFVIKTDGSGGEFNFNDGIKTFAYSAKVASNPLGNGETAWSRTSSIYGKDYYQLRINLLEEDDSFINKTYVVAQQEMENGEGGRFEAINVDLSKGIYTKQEVAQGEGLDPNLENRSYYINQVNTDYLGVPIPLFIKSLQNGASYKLDFDLCLGILDLPRDQESYSNPNAKYYFHDIYKEEYIEITNSLSYDFQKFENDGSANGGRFELFFGEISENLGVEDIQGSLANTAVYKNDGEDYIRFEDSWSQANIYVYTAVGQLVFLKKDVSTDQDYLLPLNEGNITTYIIKIENAETGESVSKKIIK